MINKNTRIIFGGTPSFASKHLEALIEQGYNIVAVYTQPDRESGRGKKIVFSPVKQIALEHNIPVEQPINFKFQEDCEKFKKYNADIFVVVAYGVILPKSILEAPKYRCVNVHGSLLPKYRGAAPIQRAVYDGEKETGITIMDMNEKLDEGNIISQHSVTIDPKETSDSLFDKLVSVGISLLKETLDQIIATNNKITTIKQDESLATYAAKLTKQEAQINFNLPAIEIEKHIRAFISWPVGYINYKDQNIKIWGAEVIEASCEKAPGTIIKIDKSGIQIATSDGIINLTELQLPGKKSMPVSAIVNGHSDLFTVGEVI
jgi:methionyl-tRNA formyltransferase